MARGRVESRSDLKRSSEGVPQVSISPVTDTPETFEDTSFLVGNDLDVLDASAALGRNATSFEFYNDGAGDIGVEVSNDGAAFGDIHNVKSEEIYKITNISVDSLRLNHTGTDSAYRAVFI